MEEEWQQELRIKPGTIIIYLLILAWVLLGILAPFLVFIFVVSITAPIIIYLLLRKRFGRTGSVLLGLLLNLLFQLLLLGIVGYVLYTDFLEMQDDFKTKTKYILYEDQGRVHVGYTIGPIPDQGTPPAKYLSAGELASPAEDSVFIFLYRPFFDGLQSPIRGPLQTQFTPSQALDQISTSIPQGQKDILLTNLLLTTFREKGPIYIFIQFKHSNLVVKPNYLTLQVAKGIPESILTYIGNEIMPALPLTQSLGT